LYVPCCTVADLADATRRGALLRGYPVRTQLHDQHSVPEGHTPSMRWRMRARAPTGVPVPRQSARLPVPQCARLRCVGADQVVDSGGSMIIHMFGAYFGIGLSLMLSNSKKRRTLKPTNLMHYLHPTSEHPTHFHVDHTHEAPVVELCHQVASPNHNGLRCDRDCLPPCSANSASAPTDPTRCVQRYNSPMGCVGCGARRRSTASSTIRRPIRLTRTP
jgi:hypothetical protein